jgi:hypothetical protein
MDFARNTEVRILLPSLSKRGVNMAKYGTLEYAEECLKDTSNVIKSFDIDTGIAVVDIRKMAENYLKYSDKRIEACGGIEDFLHGGEYHGLDDTTHELHELVYFYVQKLLFEKLKEL